MHFTPLLINVSNINFEKYIKSLSKNAKKNYRIATKKNEDLEFLKIDFDLNLVKKFMQLWEMQNISGRNIKWGFNIEYLTYLNKEKKLLCFIARKQTEKEKIISLIFVENHAGYVEPHPPIYDKKLFIERSIAKYMLYNLIKYTIENNNFIWVDLGGGNNGNWRDLLNQHRKGYTKSYKWSYVPAEIKNNPEKEKPYIIGFKIFPYQKFVIEEKNQKYNFLYKFKKKILILLYFNKGNIGKKFVLFCKKRLFDDFLVNKNHENQNK